MLTCSYLCYVCVPITEKKKKSAAAPFLLVHFRVSLSLSKDSKERVKHTKLKGQLLYMSDHVLYLRVSLTKG